MATFNELVTYAAPITELPAEKIKVWETLARGKMVLDNGLQKRSLELQSIFNDYEKMEVIPLTAAIALYRKKHGEMVEYRKTFTRFLDMASDQCMKTEKEYDMKINPLFLTVSARELALRQAAADDAVKVQNKNTEIANYTAHIKNGYYMAAANYRAALKKITHDTYIACLKARTPIDGIDTAIAVAKECRKELRPDAPTSFDFKILTVDEAATIKMQVSAPDWKLIWDESLAEMREKFSMYANDLAAAEAIVEQEVIDFNADLVQEQNNNAGVVAANVLLEQAASYTVSGPTAKPILEKKSIKILTDSQAWVLRVQVAFNTNFQAAFSKIKNVDYSKITLAQQAAALDAAGVIVDGLEYVITKK